jgi:ABC-type tungstate transport system substrate-binding protein
MFAKTSLKVILVISIIGVLFSVYLTLKEFGVFGGKSVLTCSLNGGGCQLVFGLPTCLYGLVMYLIVFVFSFLGLRARN